MARLKQQRRASLYDEGSVMRRMQELVDTLAWIRIELAPSPSYSAPVNDVTRRQRALVKMDAALDLAKQLVFELDSEMRLRRDEDESPPAAAD